LARHGVAFMLRVMTSSGATLVRRARERAGLSRRALATRAGVPTSTVSRVEDGESDPTITMLQRLLGAAGSTLLLDLADDEGSPTLAALSTAADASGERLRIDWTRLRGFADWATSHADELPAALADPPARTGTPLDAILAAFAEQLAHDHGIAVPRWTRSVGRLPSEWSAPATPRMRAEAAASTPEAFRRRNIILSRSALFRAAA
jgi:transcriptional regulator with XRE-family HTH domain